MRKNGGVILLSVLIVLLMVASTFTIFAGVSHVSEPLEIRAPGDAGRVLYVYGNNKSLADDWREYLMAQDYLVDLLPAGGLMDVEYWNYDFVILGEDSNLVPEEDLFTLYHSNVHVMGVGRGALNFVISLKLILYQNYYTHDTRNLTAPDLFIYHTPNQISGAPGDLTIYSKDAKKIYAFGIDKKPANETLYMGYFNYVKDYSTIFQINSFIFYGYTQSPKYLTSDGDLLMKNIIYYLDPSNNYDVPLSREVNQVTVDGKFTTVTEWWDYPEIRVGDRSDNYTSYYEDPFSIYILIHMN